jgi:hypothetical protein
MRNALQIFQAEDPQGYELLQVAAQLSQSEKVPPAQRMSLFLSIYDAVGPYLDKAAEEATPPAEEKPKYRWHNGARVKVK